ncbi:hypothetical protein [Actinomadura gamaensis]|uniref:Secreted protein n=1 Tax=Actinomadura gamaensis TaxID=1763541 RepID=A0ABV9U226_9ACTN
MLVFSLMVAATLGLAATAYLLWFARMSRSAQFWQAPEDETGEVRYRSPYVFARRSPGPRGPVAAPRPSGTGRPTGARTPDDRRPGTGDGPDDATAVLVGSGAG